MRDFLFSVSRIVRAVLSHKKYSIVAGIGIVLIAGLVPSSYFYRKYQQVKTVVKKASERPEDVLIAKISRHVTLPEGTPKIITVDERQLALGLPFFKKALTGDILLMYEKAGQAVLYRPSIDRVMEMAEIQVPSPSGAAGQDAKIVVFNGTKTAGRAKLFQSKILKAFPKALIVSTGNSKKDYTETQIIDISGRNKEYAAALAKELGGSVADLQPGETAPSADILVIAGK